MVDMYPQTEAEISHLRWLLRQGAFAVDSITQPDSVERTLLHGLFLAFLIWVGAQFDVHGNPLGRLVFAGLVTVLGVSLLGALYHYAIAAPLARWRQRAK